MNFKDFKKQVKNSTAEIVDVSGFSDELIELIKRKEGSFGVVLVVRDEKHCGCLLYGEWTRTLYVEYIKSNGLFRL